MDPTRVSIPPRGKYLTPGWSIPLEMDMPPRGKYLTPGWSIHIEMDAPLRGKYPTKVDGCPIKVETFYQKSSISLLWDIPVREGHPKHHRGHSIQLHHGMGLCSDNIDVAVGTWELGGDLPSPTCCIQTQEGLTVAWNQRICAKGAVASP